MGGEPISDAIRRMQDAGEPVKLLYIPATDDPFTDPAILAWFRAVAGRERTSERRPWRRRTRRYPRPWEG